MSVQVTIWTYNLKDVLAVGYAWITDLSNQEHFPEWHGGKLG